jgi:endonuclease/exonuclease/phosphatase family metal-dependent hydrolase
VSQHLMNHGQKLYSQIESRLPTGWVLLNKTIDHFEEGVSFMTSLVLLYFFQEIKYKNRIFDSNDGTYKLITYRGSLGKSYNVKISFDYLKSSGEIEKSIEDFTVMECKHGVHITKHFSTSLFNNDYGIISDEDMNMPSNFRTMQNRHRDISVMSYNIWNYNSPWEKRLEMLVSQIRKYNPDIIGFQEVRFRHELDGHHQHRPSTHQVEELAEHLVGYQYVYKPSMTYLDIKPGYFSHVDEGVAIFSKFPIHSVSQLRLSRNFSDNQDEHQRSILQADIEIPSSQLNHPYDQKSHRNKDKNNKVLLSLMVTHMSLSLEARKRNILEISEYLKTLPLQSPSSSTSFIPRVGHLFMGDLNAEPDDISIQFLTGQTVLNQQKGVFQDAWETVRGIPNLKDQSNDEFYGPDEWWTFNTFQQSPKKRIDFILYQSNGDVKPVKIFVVPNEFNCSPDIDSQPCVQPSDHRALYSVFEIK